jgi:hypothetical protein
VKEAEASHPGGVGRGMETYSPNEGNKAGAGGA